MKATRIRSKSKGVGYYCFFVLLSLICCWGVFLYRKQLEVIDFSETSLEAQSVKENLRSTESLKVTAPVMAQYIAASSSNSLHIVFSTDCSAYQDWQSLLVFHSAYQVGQIGPITRIASGCDEAKKTELKALYQKLWGRTYFVHFTPGTCYSDLSHYILNVNELK